MIVSLGFWRVRRLEAMQSGPVAERERNLPILLIADPDDRPKVLRGLELGSTTTSPARSTETSSWRGCAPTSPETLRRPAAPIGAAIDRDGAVRPADRPQQSPLARAPPSAMIETARAERGLDDDDSRHRPFQAGERHLWSRRRRSSCSRASPLSCRRSSAAATSCRWAERNRRRDAGRRRRQAARIAERARRTTEGRAFAVDGPAGAVSITVSIGLAQWREMGYRRALSPADRALYLSKVGGRNRVTQDAA